MSKKLKLTKITIETEGGDEVKLTMKEAKELYDQLNELFGVNTHYIPTQPVVIERDRWIKPYSPLYPYITWCSGADSDTGIEYPKITCDSGMSVSYQG